MFPAATIFTAPTVRPNWKEQPPQTSLTGCGDEANQNHRNPPGLIGRHRSDALGERVRARAIRDGASKYSNGAAAAAERAGDAAKAKPSR